jgi:hypothetical protein
MTGCHEVTWGLTVTPFVKMQNIAYFTNDKQP